LDTSNIGVASFVFSCLIYRIPGYWNKILRKFLKQI
jgi:hypothetical protein